MGTIMTHDRKGKVLGHSLFLYAGNQMQCSQKYIPDSCWGFSAVTYANWLPQLEDNNTVPFWL